MLRMLVLGFMLGGAAARAQEAREIVQRANDLMRGKSSYAEIVMTIVKPNWSRTVAMKTWALEPDLALVDITEPARDKGTVTLKRKNEVWNWLPSVQKVIKIPPSMMLQSWMGSDFTNDDLVRASSIVDDYTHTVLGEENLAGYDCYKIQLIPKPEAGVVWGKILLWISKDGLMELQTEYYDEDGVLMRAMLGSNPQKFGGRTLPAHWEMIPQDKPGDKTIMEYRTMQFDLDLDPDFFSLQNMKRVH